MNPPTTTCNGCGASMSWTWNPLTSRRVPVVPYDAATAPDKAIRYRVQFNDAVRPARWEAIRDDDGAFFSHFQNCPNARQFSGRNKGK